MEISLQIIPLSNLALSFTSVALALSILFRWSLHANIALYSIARMLIQLIIVGSMLIYIFTSNNLCITVAVISMIVIAIIASNWIGLRIVETESGTMVSTTKAM